MWVDERVAGFVADNFLPARVHIKDDHELFQRLAVHYGAHWTPDEGFLPANDLLAQLTLGLGHIAFNTERYGDAGVARYKSINDPKALGETAQAFDRHYQQTAWAKKASVWK